MLDIGASTALQPCGLSLVEPRVDCCLSFFDLRSRRIELLNQSLLSREIRGCPDDLFAHRTNRSRNVFEHSLRVVKLTVELSYLSLRCPNSRLDRVKGLAG